LLIMSQMIFGDFVERGYSMVSFLMSTTIKVSTICKIHGKNTKNIRNEMIFSKKVLVIKKIIVPLHPLNSKMAG